MYLTYFVSTGLTTGSSLRMHGNKNYGAHRNMCSVIFLLYQSMQEKLPMASFVVRKDEMWAMTDYEEKGRKR